MSQATLTLLQAARLKGRLRPEVAGLFAPEAAAELGALADAGLVTLTPAGARLTPAGRDRLADLIRAEHDAVDQAQLEVLYDEFDRHNRAIKATITSWQVKPDGTANDHADPAYDGDVIGQLALGHERFEPLLTKVAVVAPRLSHYPARFADAISRARSGDAGAVAHPLQDSYHQIWFELHEDLIGLLGRSREAEASAGRAE